MYEYYILKDKKRKGLLVRQNPETMEEMYYNSQEFRWVSCDLILKYMQSENELYGQYDSISDKEALVYLNRLLFMKYYDDGFAYPEN